MKYNKKSQAYSRAVIRKIKRDDFAQLRNIRELLVDVDTYIVGMLSRVEEDVVKGDEFDYIRFNRLSRSYFSKLETFINTQYNTIVRLVKKTQKQIYFGYRKDIFDHLKKMGILPSVLAEADVRVGFGGTPNQSFTQHLLKQTQIGQDPAVLIKTVSQEHVKLIQKQIMMATSKGRGFGWAKDRMMRELYPKVTREALNKTMEYNVTRIMRTSYMRAVNLDTTDFVAQNTEIFYGSRRTADGYPCFGCIMMDGMIYGPGAILEDHPNGQCILVPLVYPDEFLNTGVITKGVKDTFSPTFAEKFYAAAEAEQMRMMGNRALFRLWKKEKFDPSFIVDKSGNVFSYRRTVVELPKLGGISNPKVSFLNDGLKKSLSPIMDSKDRLEKGFTVVRKRPVGGMKNGIDLVGDGSDFVGANISNEVKSKIMALYGEEANLSWFRFNARARELGIFTRKDVNGKLYYVVRDKDIVKKAAKVRVKPVEKIPTIRFEGTIEDFYKLDSEINFRKLEGLDKIRWSPDGQARVIMDGNSVEGMEIRIQKLWDKKGLKSHYRFEFKLMVEDGNLLGKELQRKGIKIKKNANLKAAKKDKKGLLKADEIGPTKKEVYNFDAFIVNQDTIFYNKVRDLVSSFTNKMVVDVHEELLKDAVKKFVIRMDGLGLRKVTAVSTQAQKEKYILNRIKWADKKKAALDIKKVTMKISDDGYTTFYKGLSKNVLDDVEHLYLNMRASNVKKLVDSGVLKSTEERMAMGLSNLKEGMSCMADLGTGGGSSVFTRVAPKTKKRIDFRGGRGDVRLIIDKKELNRLDWYGYRYDMFGDVSEIEEFFEGRNLFLKNQIKDFTENNEVMFRTRLSFSNVKEIRVKHKLAYEDLLKDLESHGIFEINGVALDKFITY